MKKINLLITVIIIVTIFTNKVNAQFIIDHSTEIKLKSYGLDPHNYNQVIDSLDTKNEYKRLWLIDWVGEEKLYNAIPKLKSLFYQNTQEEHISRGMGQKSRILWTITKLEDTAFQQEFRQELDSLSLVPEENYREIGWFSAYLMEKHNDPYGWQYVKRHFTPPLSKYYINDFEIKPFLNSTYRQEAVETLRHRAANSDDIALEMLAEIKDPETEQLAANMSLHSPKSFSRYIANKVLEKINAPSYVSTLKTALNTDEENRTDIYTRLLKTGQPTVYKYVVDIYKSKQFPADSSIILQELDSYYLAYPFDSLKVTSLIDSLTSAIEQFYSFGWLGNQDLVNQLQLYISNAKTLYLSNDTVAAREQLITFREKLDYELRDTTERVTSFIEYYAWKYLNNRSYFIGERIVSEEITGTLDSVFPNSVFSGSPDIYVKVRGSGFDSSNLFFWNSNAYLDFNVISPNEVEIKIPSEFLLTPSINGINVWAPFVEYSDSLIFKVIEPTLKVSLKTSTGLLLTGGSLQYYDTQWKPAVNNGDGTFTVTTTQPTVNLKLTYDDMTAEANNVNIQLGSYEFKTVNVTAQLKNSTGASFPFPAGKIAYIGYFTGTVQKSLGNLTSTVQSVSKELLPGSYQIRVMYEYLHNDKTVEVTGTNVNVEFQTISATMIVKDKQGKLLSGVNGLYNSTFVQRVGPQLFGKTDSKGEVKKEILAVKTKVSVSINNRVTSMDHDFRINPVAVLITI